MKMLRLISIFACSVAVARADLTVVEKLDGAGPVSDLTIKIKGDKTRVETSPKFTMIIDWRTGEIINLMNEQKRVRRISGDKAKAMAEMANKFLSKKEAADKPAAPKATGRKETIDGYETQEYVSDAPNYHAVYWVAAAYPGYQAILKQMEVMQNGAFAAVKQGMPDYHGLPGLPLRCQVKMEGHEEIVSTIKSVTQNPLPDSEFTIPAGYEEMKMPDIFGGKKAAAPDGKPANE
jgi:hypothetical protein